MKNVIRANGFICGTNKKWNLPATSDLRRRPTIPPRLPFPKELT